MRLRVVGEVVAEYDYRDEQGKLLFQVLRMQPKTFRQRKPNGLGGWEWTTAGVRRVLYRLPELLASAGTVYLVEGEKDVATLERHGLTATCNPGGAGKWKFVADGARGWLKGRDVAIVADADEPGRKHAEEVRASLSGVVKSVRVVSPPNGHKDVSDAEGEGFAWLTEAPEPEAPRSPSDELAPELDYDDIWAPIESVPLVVPGLGICPGPVHLVAGSWYTGKTLFLLAIGMSVAAGKALFGLHFVNRGKWIHFDHEMGKRSYQRYMQRLRAGLGIDIEDMRGYVSPRILPQLNLCTSGALDHYCRLLEGRQLCTIDPLRAATPGQNENDSEYRQWVDLLNAVSNRTGCAIVLLHHGGKPTDGAKRRNTGRGTSAIDDAVQSKFVLTAEEKGAPIQVSHEKTRELASPLEDFWLKIENSENAVRLVHLAKEQVGEAVSRRLEAQEAAKLSKAEEAIRDALAGFRGRFRGSREEFLAVVKGDRNMLSRAFTLMKSNGGIIVGGKRGETVISMAV